MGRPIFPYETADPDFTWLLTTFQERKPGYICLEQSCLPLVLIPSERSVEQLEDPVTPPKTEEEAVRR